MAKIGIAFLLIGLLIFAYIYFPIAKVELEYDFGPPKIVNVIDNNFSVVIPKIGANSRIIANVDPSNPREYQEALAKGVALAKGTKWFLFAHSADNPLDITRYNAVFYLLDKLEKGDEIDLYYQGQKYLYFVTGKKIIEPSDTSYLTRQPDGQILTLMTCWPPGTTLKRLIIVAQIFPSRSG